MEQSVLIKHADSMVCVLRNMIIEFDKYKNIFSDNYMCVLERILAFGSHVYSLYIVKHYKELDQQTLLDFDKWLKEYNVDLYNKLDMCRFSDKIPLCFIKKWRNKSHTIIFLRELYQLYIYMFGKA